MSAQERDNEEITSSTDLQKNGVSESGGGAAPTSSASLRPPAKRPAPAVIEISDTDSDDSDVCAITSYQATADEVKRIRGDGDEDYSSTSSSSYSSDSESSWEDDSIVLDDEVTVRKAVQAQLNPRANRTDDPVFNRKLKAEELIEKLTTHWTEKTDYKTSDVTLTSDPFRLCLLQDFLSNPEIINNIVDDMNTLDWNRKKMDLFEFHQTADLANLTWQRSIRGIYELLKTEVMNWVSRVTGLSLSHVSASCSLYGPGDHLLVHDDLMADRRVAFILYLAPWTPPRAPPAGAGDTVEVEEAVGWSARMGGALRLLAADEAGRAAAPARAVLPSNNMLAFFKVGPESFHMVEEVVSLELPRLSINGWFHGAAPPERLPPPPDIDCTRLKPHNDVVLMGSWLDATYMSPRSRAQVQQQMEQASEVCLRRLLQPPALAALRAALAAPDVEWESCGPGVLRQCARVSPSWLGPPASPAPPEDPPGPLEDPVRGLARLLTSRAFFQLLAACTDLELKTYERLEIQRWRAGDYTLLPPREQYLEPRLELVFYVGVPPRPLSGGGVTFVAPEEGHAEGPAEGPTDGAPLVSVPPECNALSLVYCDAGAAPFTKYLSKLTMQPHECFYLITAAYRE